jgi:hypothetical protein
MSNTEINKLLDGVVEYLYGFGNGGDCCPSYDDAQEFKDEMERVKELIAEKDSEIAALKQQDNWIPIEDKSKLEDPKEHIIQYKDGRVTVAMFAFGKFYHSMPEGKITHYQPLPEPKK